MTSLFKTLGDFGWIVFALIATALCFAHAIPTAHGDEIQLFRSHPIGFTTADGGSGPQICLFTARPTASSTVISLFNPPISLFCCRQPDIELFCGTTPLETTVPAETEPADADQCHASVPPDSEVPAVTTESVDDRSTNPAIDARPYMYAYGADWCSVCPGWFKRLGNGDSRLRIICIKGPPETFPDHIQKQAAATAWPVINWNSPTGKGVMRHVPGTTTLDELVVIAKSEPGEIPKLKSK